ncbi:MAG: NUDIX hydrolase [Oscillospiraceae bacterium]|nr:NUDIX hydrolase [Oscillospiraceae bacterium]
MDLTERTLSSREVFHGRIVRLRVDEVRLPNGKTAKREVIDHPGGVCILALDDQRRAAVVRQYRYAFGRVMTELPAGKLEPGEEPFSTAQRELAEEVGATAAEWTDLGELIPSPGCYAETLHMYMARGLTFRAPNPDEDEFLETEFVPLAELEEQCLSGQIRDAKTVAAVLKVRAMGL